MSALDRLLDLPRFADAGAAAYRPGLERMDAVLDAMGHPEREYPVVHIGGTNGKGSTASMAAAILTAAGRRVGLHTSPHLLHLGERMRIDGQSASEAWLVDTAERFEPSFDAIGASFFEATTAMALAHFAEGGVDVAVVEVGLGGRLDATNVLMPILSAVTNIGLDHTDLLGETIEQIAGEKAGIAKSGVPFLTTAEGAALDILRAGAEGAGAPFENVRETVRLVRTGDATISITTPTRDYGALTLGLAGRHQEWNAALAVRIAEGAEPHLEDASARTGLRDVVQLAGLRGRGEVASSDRRIVLDVAHNSDGWNAAFSAQGARSAGRRYAVIGVMADKDPAALGAALAAAGVIALPVALPSPRALSAPALSAAVSRAGAQTLDAGPTVAAALDWFRRRAGAGDSLLVTGSHVTVAQAMKVLG